MIYTISHPSKIIDAEITLPFSKSLSNRALIISQLCDQKFEINNLSDSSDTQKLLYALQNTSNTIDVGDCGTAFRFLTALLAISKKTYTLKGSPRMHQRPIKILVDALRQIGADIRYLENEGYPPLLIKGKTLLGNKVSVKANISSQYISALLLIAPSLKNGLNITLEGNILSKPYISMTLKMMAFFGVHADWKDNSILIKAQQYKPQPIDIESDWSSLAFLLQAMVFANKAKVSVNGLFEESWQGDSKVLNLFEDFGIKYHFENKTLQLHKDTDSISLIKNSELNLSDYPDLAQAYSCAISGSKNSILLKGLDNLKYKESHRLMALNKELLKIGQKTRFNNSEFEIISSILNPPIESFETHNDHRMAMCLAPFGILFNIKMKEIEVVEKSYPNFWNDMNTLGFTISPTID